MQAVYQNCIQTYTDLDPEYIILAYHDYLQSFKIICHSVQLK
jgi:hypothetical protein